MFVAISFPNTHNALFDIAVAGFSLAAFLHVHANKQLTILYISYVHM